MADRLLVHRLSASLNPLRPPKNPIPYLEL